MKVGQLSEDGFYFLFFCFRRCYVSSLTLSMLPRPLHTHPTSRYVLFLSFHRLWRGAGVLREAIAISFQYTKYYITTFPPAENWKLKSYTVKAYMKRLLCGWRWRRRHYFVPQKRNHCAWGSFGGKYGQKNWNLIPGNISFIIKQYIWQKIWQYYKIKQMIVHFYF